MTPVRIRPASPQDFAALSRLFHEFHEFHVRGVPDRLVSPESLTATDIDMHSDLCKALNRIFSDENAALFVFTVAGVPVGMAEVYLRDDEPDPLRMASTYGYVQSLFVREEFRGEGIGRKLLAAAQRWAEARGAVEIRADIWEFSGGPSKFYEHLGFKSLRRTLIYVL